MQKRKPQPKQSPIIESLEELIKTYDRAQLSGALHTLKHDLSWKLLQSALIKEYQEKVVLQMGLCKQDGKGQAAAFEAGCAETLLDTATALIPKYIDLLEGRTSVVENPPPPEE